MGNHLGDFGLARGIDASIASRISLRGKSKFACGINVL
jgi:hypothetical protein